MLFREKKSHFIAAGAAGVLVIALTALGALYYASHHKRKLIPDFVIKAAHTPLYVPSKESEFSMIPSSVELKDSSVIFNINVPGYSEPIGVSEQKKPTDFDPLQEEKAPVALPFSRDVYIAYGKAKFDQYGAKKVVSAVTNDGTWLIFNITNLNEDRAKQLVQSFTLYKP